jgi:hypothetical protein
VLVTRPTKTRSASLLALLVREGGWEVDARENAVGRN